jgi:uncharacterized protein YodC (DUF2158 family)
MVHPGKCHRQTVVEVAHGGAKMIIISDQEGMTL